MKNLLINVTLLFLAALALFSCTVKQEFEQEGVTILNVSLRDGSGRTVMGQSVGEQRKVYWCDGDCLSLDGTASNPLSGVGESASSAVFTFPGVHTAPFNLLYPASFWKNASTITLPAEQEYASGSFASNSAPLAAHVTSVSGSILLGHLCTVLQLSVSKDAGVSASSLSTVRFYGNADEQVCGDFSIDYTVPSLSPAAESEEGRELVLSVAQPLDSETPLELYLVVPAGEYASGFSVVLEDNQHRTMTKVKNGAVTLSAGSLKKMTAFTFVPSSIATEFEIADIIEDYIEPDAGEYNLTGRVVDNAGKGLQGVVVSDGLRCVQTMPDGKFFMQSSLASVKFVYVSSPSGYMPAVSGGIPRFYKLLSEVTPSAGVYDMGDYVMTPVANPDRFTLLITADPQPRFVHDFVVFREHEERGVRAVARDAAHAHEIVVVGDIAADVPAESVEALAPVGLVAVVFDRVEVGAGAHAPQGQVPGDGVDHGRIDAAVADIITLLGAAGAVGASRHRRERNARNVPHLHVALRNGDGRTARPALVVGDSVHDFAHPYGQAGKFG